MFCSKSIRSNEEAEDFLNFDEGDLVEETTLLNEDELLLSEDEEGDYYYFLNISTRNLPNLIFFRIYKG